MLAPTPIPFQPTQEPLILLAKSFFSPPHPNPLPPLGGEGIRGKNFWQTLDLRTLTAESAAGKIRLLHQFGLQGPKTEIGSPAARARQDTGTRQ
jgi:hypothetical protein